MACFTCGRSVVSMNSPIRTKTSLLKFHDKNAVPVNGFRYVHPKTGFEFNSDYKNFDELMAHIHSYNRQNGHKTITREEVENWLCDQPGMEFFCGKVVRNIERTLKQYKSGLVAFIKEVFGGEPVKQEIANERARRCSICPYNVRVTGLSVNQNLTNIIAMKSKAGKHTPYDSRLYICEKCTCPLVAKVHSPQNIVEESLTPEQKESLQLPIQSKTSESILCWQVHKV